MAGGGQSPQENRAEPGSALKESRNGQRGGRGLLGEEVRWASIAPSSQSSRISTRDPCVRSSWREGWERVSYLIHGEPGIWAQLCSECGSERSGILRTPSLPCLLSNWAVTLDLCHHHAPPHTHIPRSGFWESALQPKGLLVMGQAGRAGPLTSLTRQGAGGRLLAWVCTPALTFSV